MATSFKALPDLLRGSDVEELKDALVHTLFGFHQTLLLTREEMVHTRPLSSELEKALEQVRRANQDASPTIEQRMALGAVAKRVREVRSSLSEQAATEGGEQGNLSTEAGAS